MANYAHTAVKAHGIHRRYGKLWQPFVRDLLHRIFASHKINETLSHPT